MNNQQKGIVMTPPKWRKAYKKARFRKQRRRFRARTGLQKWVGCSE